MIVLSAAFAASLWLTRVTTTRGYGIGASVVSAVALLLAMDILRIKLPYVSMSIAVALTVLGVVLVMKASEKGSTVAATVVTTVGALRLLTLLS